MASRIKFAGLPLATIFASLLLRLRFAACARSNFPWPTSEPDERISLSEIPLIKRRASIKAESCGGGVGACEAWELPVILC
jgi:hypothetical protein